MKGNLTMIYMTEKEYTNGLQNIENILVISLKESLMVKELINMEMEVYMKAIIKKELNMDMVLILGQMVKNVEEIGLIINCMEMPVLKMVIKNIILLSDSGKLLLQVKSMRIKLLNLRLIILLIKILLIILKNINVHFAEN